KYGITNLRRLKNYEVEGIKENKRVMIKSDLPIMTQLKIHENKPDLLIHDKLTNTITIIEVGVTNKEILHKVETDKKHKYETLGKELKSMYKCDIVIIPYVITWDGLVTELNKKYCNQMRLPE
ncbi:hypothetical protein ENBRE01_2250, partial [Enteropsectra breve]